tara:strand:- start:5569 stop:6150 length:582 start_codon:yes stop_codon:yes gene_type:complete
MPRKKDENIIRVGDKVRVINPEFFVRCGYPKDFNDVAADISVRYRTNIERLMAEVGIVPDLFSNEGDRAFQKIAKALAYAKLKKEGFGGSIRSIYTQRKDEHEGREFRVDRIFFVKTGKRVPGHVRPMGDVEDYELPYLANEKTHKILHIYANDSITYDGQEIEAKNVEKLSILQKTDFSPEQRIIMGNSVVK